MGFKDASRRELSSGEIYNSNNDDIQWNRLARFGTYSVYAPICFCKVRAACKNSV
jgi:hypothetical protein